MCLSSIGTRACEQSKIINQTAEVNKQTEGGDTVEIIV